ncbi:MAG: DUF1080 domain-containing protein, partial [Verrucomicrobiales bacterium]|nr:DUF1080 domain-containing protein [Verrucomicrobiales bacterium]
TTGEILHQIDLGNGEIRPSINMQVSRSDYRVSTFCGSRDFTKGNHWWVAVVDAASGQVILPTIDRPDYSDGAAFQPGGKTLLLAENYISLIKVDLEQNEVGSSHLKFWAGNGGERVLFDSTGTRVFSKNMKMINGWTWPEGVHRFVQKPGFVEFALRPGRENGILASRGNAGLLLNTDDGEIEHTFPEPGKVHNAVFPAKNGDLIITGRDIESGLENPRSLLTVWDLKGLEGHQSIQMADRPNKDQNQAIQSAGHHVTQHRFARLAGDGANVWDTKTGKLVHRFRSPNQDTKYRALAMATRGETLAVCDTEGTVQVFDLESGEGLHSFRVDDPVRELALSPDGNWLAAKEEGKVRMNNGSEETRGKRFRFWNLPEDKLIYQLEASTLYGWKHTIRFSPDNQFAIAVTRETSSTESGTYEATLLDLTTGDTSVYVCEDRHANNFNWNPNSSVTGFDRFAFVDDRHFVIGRNCWRISPEKEIEFLGNLGHEDANSKVAVIPGADWVAVEDGTAGTFQLWNPKTRAPVSRPIFHGKQILALAAHPNGRTIAVGDAEGGIKLWDWRSGKSVSPRLQLRNSLEPARLFFNPDGTRLIAVNRDGLVERWELPEIPRLNPTGLSHIAESISRRRINSLGAVEPVSPQTTLDQWRQSPWPELTRASLSESSEASGEWLALFDGRSLDGWESLEPGDTGFTKQGELLKMESRESDSRFLIFTGTDDVFPAFRDFIFRTQFRVADDSVGDIYFHSEINRARHPTRGNRIRISGKPQGASGSICDLRWIHDFVARPEQWHELEIEVQGNRITTRIDGLPAALWDEPPGWEGLHGLDRKLGAGTFVLRIDQGEIFLKEMQVRSLGAQPSLTSRASARQQLGQVRLDQGKNEEAGQWFEETLELLLSCDPAPEQAGIAASACEGLLKSGTNSGNFPLPTLLDLAERYRSLLPTLETGSEAYFELVKNAGTLDASLFEVYLDRGEEPKGRQLIDEGIRWFKNAMEATSASEQADVVWDSQKQAYATCLKKCSQVPPSLLDTIEYAKQNFKRSTYPVARLQFAAELGKECGKISFEAGNQIKGMELVEQSLEVRSWLAEKEPDNFDYLSDVDESRGILAGMYSRVGRDKEAAALRRSRYQSMMEKFHHPNYTNQEAALNAAAQRINGILDQRDSLSDPDWEWIRGEIEGLITHLKKFDWNHREIDDAVSAISTAAMKIGDHHYRRDEIEKARDDFKQGIALPIEAIPHADTPELRDTYWRLAGDRLRWYRDRSQAWDTALLEELLDRAEPIAQSHPGLGREQRFPAIALRTLSAKVAMSNDLETSIELRKRALVYETRLVEKLPNEAWPVYDLVDDYLRLGDIQRRAEKHEDAEQSYQTAIKRGEKAVTQFPGNEANFHKAVGETQRNLARLYRVTGRKEEAWELYHRAVPHLETSAQLNPTYNAPKDLAAGLLSGLGSLYQNEKKDWDQAESYYRRALVWRQLTADNLPQDIKRQTELARCCEQLAGLLFLKDPKSNEADHLDQKAIAILEKIAATGKLSEPGASVLKHSKSRINQRSASLLEVE